MKQRNPRRRWRKVLLILTLAPLVLLAAGWVFLQTEYARGTLRSLANSALEGQFTGQIVVDQIDGIGLQGARKVDAHLVDAAGQKVVELYDLDADIDVLALAWNLIRSGGALQQLVIEAIDIAHVEVRLRDDRGIPSLAHALMPAPRPSAEPSAPSGSTFELRIDHLALRHAWIHGELQGGPPLDLELHQLEGSLSLGGSGLQAKLSGLDVEARSLPPRSLRTKASLSGDFALPPDGDLERASAQLKLRADLAGSEIAIDANLREGVVDSTLRLPRLTPSFWKRVAGYEAAKVDAELTAHITGRWPSLHVQADAGAGQTRLGLDGQVELSDALEARVRLNVTGLNVAEWSGSDATRSDLNFEVQTTLSQVSESHWRIDYELDLSRGSFAGQAVPPGLVQGNAQLSEEGLSTQGKLVLAEPGANTEIDYRLVNSNSLELTLDTRLASPPRLRAFEVQLAGSLQARVSYALDSQRVDAQVNANLQALQAAGQRADRVQLSGNVRGPLASALFSVKLDARQLRLAGFPLQAASLSATGTPARFAVQTKLLAEDGRQLEGQSRVVVTDVISLLTPRFMLSGKQSVLLEAELVSGSPARGRVQNLRLRGAGWLDGDLEWGPGQQRVSLQVGNLDIARLLELATLERPPISAKMNGDVSLVFRTAGRPDGTIDLVFENIRADVVKQGRAELHLSLKGESATGSLVASSIASTLEVEVSELTVPRTLASLEPQALAGVVSAKGDVLLEELTPILASLQVPLEQASGRLIFALELENQPSFAGIPKLEARLHTERLRLVGQRAPADVQQSASVHEAAPLALSGLDLELELSVQPTDRRLALRTRVLDDQGPALEGQLHTTLPTALASASWASLRGLPLEATLRLNPRRLEKLPALLRPQALAGCAMADLSLKGSLAQPKLAGFGRVRDFHGVDSDQVVHLAFELDAEPRKAMVSLVADTEEDSGAGPPAAKLEARVTGNIFEFTRAPELVVDLALELHDFPLEVVPYDEPLSGTVAGKLTLQDYLRDATLEGELEVSALGLGTASLPKLRLATKFEQRQLAVDVQAQSDEGTLSLRLDASADWGPRPIPQLSSDVTATLRARRFDLAVVQPWVVSQLPELGGRLDGEVSARLSPTGRNLSGRLEINEGRLFVAPLGQRFTDARVVVSLDGSDVRLEKLEASALTGKLEGEGRASFDASGLRHAEGSLHIDRSRKIPVSLQGAGLGDAWGTLTASYDRADQRHDLKLTVKRLTLDLIDAPPPDLQSLEPAADIRVGTWRRDQKFVSIPVRPPSEQEEEVASSESPGPPLTVSIQLDEVRIQRGQSIDVTLRGQLTALLTSKTELVGRLELAGGILDVSGKRFAVESGVITFLGDEPSNPTVTATARWDSPEGYSVYAEYAGTVENGNLTLRAEPPLSQDEIVNLLLFGSPDAAVGAGAESGSSASIALGVAGGTAVKGINESLSRFTNLDVSARLDTSTGSARPELVVRLSPRVSASITQTVGEPLPGESPDRTYLTVDFGLRKGWVLSGEVGDRGASGLDLIWRRRY